MIQEIPAPIIQSLSVEPERLQKPITRGLVLPIIDVPNPVLNYPVVDVPTQEQFDSAVKAEHQKTEEHSEKTRGLPDTSPSQLPQVLQTLPTHTPIAEIPADKPDTPTLTVFGTNINLPDPSVIATAGAVAVVTTAATVASTAVFNALRNATEPLIKQAVKSKFKIKIKQIKPVLHYVMTDSGHIDVFEYSSSGTKLVAQTDNVEQYIRDQIDLNTLYEIENKIIIDDIIKDKFTKEGQERFKSLYAPPRKIAKKLSARLSF